VPGSRPVVALAANSNWNIVNFRVGLIRALKKAGYEPVVIAPEDPIAERRMGEVGVRRIALRIDRSGVNPIADVRLLRDYRRILEQLRPAAFLGFTIKPNIFGSLAATSLNIPAVPNVSGLGTAFIRSGPLQWIVTKLYRRAFRDVPVVLFQNPDDRQLFVIRRIVEAGRTRLVPGSGVDLDRFAPAPQPDDPLTFLLIARLLRDKGVIEYVQAAHSLRQELPAARFQLLGPIDEGNRTAISKSELNRWIRDGVIEYLGTVDDVRPHIAAASAVVLPSYREGLPRSLLEAAAMARPLIATQVPGCREVVENGVNGFLCNPAEPESLALAIKKFAELPRESRAAMGEASRRKVQDRFSEQVVVRAYLDVLNRLLGGQHQGFDA
jgi:glycosyltransferase involved in cell wall biosynthesis